MSKIDDMIKRLCPNGVETKTLGELGDFYGGLTGKSKEDFKDGNAKFITYMNVYSNLKLNLNTDEKVKISDGEKQHTIEYGDVLFTGSSETPDECGMSSVLCNKTNEKLYLNSFSFGFRFFDKTLFEPEFTKYLFRSSDLRKQIIKTASGVTRFNVSKERMKKVKIPIPPIEVQKEIAHILDRFTELAAELAAELTARRKQYEFYRDQLLSFTNVRGGLTFGNRPENVKWMPLGQCCDMKAGKAISASNIYSEPTRDVSIPCYGGNGLRGYVAQENQNGNFCLIGRQGALCGNVCFATGKFYATEHAVVVKNNSSLKSRFLFHLLTNMNLNQYKSQGAQPGLAVGKLEEIKIPVPSLEIQEKIVHVLDNFDAVCNDLKIGLPAEIEARKKQYEYYRDRLLAFTPPPGKQ